MQTLVYMYCVLMHIQFYINKWYILSVSCWSNVLFELFLYHLCELYL